MLMKYEVYGPTSFVDLSEKILRGGDENGRGCNELLARTEIISIPGTIYHST
jgi:hypothetical protein